MSLIGEDTCRSIVRLLKKKLVKLPQISPAPDSTVPSKDFSKVLAKANELKKAHGDSFLGVDVLLEALLENKDIQEALNEAGTALTLYHVFEAFFLM